MSASYATLDGGIASFEPPSGEDSSAPVWGFEASKLPCPLPGGSEWLNSCLAAIKVGIDRHFDTVALIKTEAGTWLCAVVISRGWVDPDPRQNRIAIDLWYTPRLAFELEPIDACRILASQGCEIPDSLRDIRAMRRRQGAKARKRKTKPRLPRETETTYQRVWNAYTVRSKPVDLYNLASDLSLTHAVVEAAVTCMRKRETRRRKKSRQ